VVSAGLHARGIGRLARRIAATLDGLVFLERGRAGIAKQDRRRNAKQESGNGRKAEKFLHHWHPENVPGASCQFTAGSTTKTGAGGTNPNV
jgi:hypothetical protein